VDYASSHLYLTTAPLTDQAHDCNLRRNETGFSESPWMQDMQTKKDKSKRLDKIDAEEKRKCHLTGV
jgi:hypothetical protein